MKQAAVYRHYDTTGALLYVGISRNLIGRQAQHMRGSSWAREIARIDIEWHPSEGAALEAESAAIEAEAPKYNIRRRASGSIDVTECAWREGLAAIVAGSGMSMRAISTAAGLGAGYLHSIINDGKEPTISNLASVCAVLGVGIERVLAVQGGAA